MPVVPFTATQSKFAAAQAKGKVPQGPPPAEPFALMAAAQMHSEGRLVDQTDAKPEALEDSVRRMGSVRFAPETYDDPKDQKFLKNLPDDVEKIDRGNTIELRIRQKADEDLTS